MKLFHDKLQEVSQFYQNNDLNLGFRRIIDCALDTNDAEIFKEIISFADWRTDSANKTEEQEVEKAISILRKIENAGTAPEQTSFTNIISAQKITKVYNKGNFRLGPLSITVNRFEIVGLVGENGNGKTTLLRLLGGELKPTAGSIDYKFSSDYKNQYDLRTRLVYIPQRIEKLRGTLMENLQFTLSQHSIKGEENELLAQVMLARMGLWPYKKLNWNRLSSGYKMRFELARTLLRKPEVLLLDEPLANLDILAQQIILEDLKFLSASLIRPFGIVLSSQQLYEVEKVSDKILFLDNGKPIENNKEEDETGQEALILEFDTEIEREELKQLLLSEGLQKLQFNGGNYVAHFHKEKKISDVMYAFGKNGIQISYLRDISNSSRRFFID